MKGGRSMDIFEFAIEMEKDGEEYYRKQATENKNRELEAVFTSLADDEKMHADVLRKKQKKTGYEMETSNVEDYMNVFKGEDKFKMETKAEPEQIDFYRKALEKEQESIDLYRKMLSDAEGADETELFGWIIGQEQGHYNLLYDLITLLERAKSWVESPEFGVREDY
jgi:rubrerythrin